MHQNAEERLELLHTISDIVGIEVEKRMHAFTDVEHFSVRDASMAKPASGPLTSEQDKKNPYINNLSPQSVRNKRRDTNKQFINMRKKLLLLCALLISVITLSGAANRSFRTEMEQWNPIGFTQAPSGSSITNRLTAGSAILPTVATAAPSGVLRGGSENVITFKTSKKSGESVKLKMTYTGSLSLDGLTGTPTSGTEVTYTLTSQTVTIRGDVTVLYCNGNQLTTLDVSQNTALKELYCSNNQLTELDLSHNTALTQLWCFKNQLTALDVSQNTALTWLLCSDNQLTALDVSQNTALTTLACQRNQLTALDVSPNIALTELVCRRNQLTALDVSKNTALTTLVCAENQLAALDVSKNTALTDLYCSDNQLTALDVTPNADLIVLVCSGNQIKGGEMTRLVNSLPDRTGMDAGEFTVVQEPRPEGNRCLKTHVAIAKGKNWNTYKYNSDTEEYVAYEGEEASPNEITFTTAKAVGERVDLLMNYTGAAPTLSGLDGTPKSGEWRTYTLTSQTVTIRGDLTVLYCYDNQLTALDVSKNTKLTYLNCESNQLTALDVSQNTALTWLDCSGNQIKGEEMTRLVNSLPDRMGMEAGEFTVVQEPSPESNRCLKSDVAIAKSKNWNTQKYNSDTKEFVPYEGEEPIPYAVTLTKEGEGTITATGATDLNAVPEGTELTIEATPAAGYELTALTANGTDILATKKFVVTAATEVKAIFAKTYAVTLTKEGEGTITATGADNLNAVPEGTELTIVATPATGYELKALTANGTDILAAKKFVVTAATEVKATFAKKTAADVVESSSVRLYPNPASTYVNVKGAKADALVRLYDANGTLQYEARTDADGTLQIDLSAYPEGTYLLRVGNDAQRPLIQR